MGAEINVNQIVKKEPYQSIATLLDKFPEGLELKHIQYAIAKEHHLNRSTEKKVKETFGDKIDDLIKSGIIKQHEIKQIERTKNKRQRSKDPGFMEGKRVRNNIRNFLRKMMVPQNNVIIKDQGKYKLSGGSFVDILKIENDLDILDKLRKIKLRSFDDGRINLYGLQIQKELHVDHVENTAKMVISDETQEKIDIAIQKIKSGIDDLQMLVDHSLGWYISKDESFKYVSDERFPLLDRQLLVIYRSYLFESFKSLDTPKLDKWMPYNVVKPLIVKPDDELIEIFKKHFYPSKNKDEIRSMLNNHKVNEEIKVAMAGLSSLKLDTIICSHMVAVVHSRSGTIVNDDLRDKLPDDVKDSLNIGPFVNSTEFLKNYFESDDQLLQKHIKKSGVKKMLKDKEPLTTDDLINFHKTML